MPALLRALVVLSVLSCLACSGDSSAHDPDPTAPAARDEAPAAEALQWVAVGRTPGKPLQLVDPSQPAESIRARRGADGPELVVVRNLGQAPEDRVETVAPLSEDEFAAVQEAFAAAALASWEPDPEGEAVDWGAALLHYALGEAQTRKTWTQPLNNGEGVDALTALLVELAREKAPTPELHYLR